MKQIINITAHEYKMLMEGYHPEFESDDGFGDFVEHGKGADIIYRKNVIRKSDSAELWFEYAHNSEGGFNHDEPRDGDFQIDPSKKDTLDPFDELKLEEELCIEAKPRTIRDDYADIENECVVFDLKDPTISPDILVSLFNSYKSAKSLADLEIEFNKIFEVSCEHKLLAQSIKNVFDSHNLKSKAWINNYKDDYNEKFNILTDINIQGQNFKLTAKEIKKLRKALH